MTQMTLTLADFLLARIAEQADFWSVVGECKQAHPQRVDKYTAIFTAMRRVVERHVSTGVQDHGWFDCTCGFQNHRLALCEACGHITFDDGDFERPFGPCPDLRLLAAPFADHRDYRAEWAVQ